MSASETLLIESGLSDAIQCLIDSATEPFSEYQLIQTLNQQGWDLSTSAEDSLSLFTSHFLIFNALYQLQVAYWESQQRYLEISALRIQLHPPVETESEATAMSAYADESTLRAYYLDLSQLEAATESSVNQLLNQFWEHYIAKDESFEALEEFSLTHPTTYKEVKKSYRQLAMAHHPDRGGDPKKFQRINWAFGVLQRVYKN